MSIFDKLAPFIQDYIYRNGWEELRGIQVAACDIIFNTDSNLLIATPTASGKTEAAFLPVITKLYETPSLSVGVLYIAPLKALINDQFARIEELLEEAYIPVTKWHGDVSANMKNRLLKNPSGILQTTPESLEAMIMKRKEQAVKLFSDLRFIIIDEVHNFLGEERGTQLISLLERLAKLTGNNPRRIGLSATLGDIRGAEKWLSSGTGRLCVTPDIGIKRRKAVVMAEHFHEFALQDEKHKNTGEFFGYIYDITRGRKSIIFSNSRAEVERNIVNLKDLAVKKGEPDVFMVHHGSISASDREYVEEQMRLSELPLVTGATVTLELGIDLGDLERIVQVGCPKSVASLSQRLGRSGRRNGVSEMCFLFDEEKQSESSEFYKLINWSFVKCIALIELYRENRIEPVLPEHYPFGILYHQTMSFLYGRGEIKAYNLAQSMLSEAVFSHIDKEDYKELLKHMLKIGHIEKTENGGLIIGIEGERIVNHYDFYSVFETDVEYSVREGSHEIGTLTRLMQPDTTFVLGGKTWLVIDIDKQNKTIYVEKANGKPPTVWDGTGEVMEHTMVLKKMKDIITSDAYFPYLGEGAKKRLAEIRLVAKGAGLSDKEIFEISPNTFGVALWLGTRALNSVDFLLNKLLPERKFAESYWPFLIVKNVTKEELINALKYIRENEVTENDYIVPKDARPMGKYNDYIPDNLLKKQYIDRYTDINEMKKEIFKL